MKNIQFAATTEDQIAAKKKEHEDYGWSVMQIATLLIGVGEIKNQSKYYERIFDFFILICFKRELM